MGAKTAAQRLGQRMRAGESIGFRAAFGSDDSFYELHVFGELSHGRPSVNLRVMWGGERAIDAVLAGTAKAPQGAFPKVYQSNHPSFGLALKRFAKSVRSGDLPAIAKLEPRFGSIALLEGSEELLPEVLLAFAETFESEVPVDLDARRSAWKEIVHNANQALALAGKKLEEARNPSPETQGQREWDRIASAEGDRIRIAHDDPDIPPDIELLAKSKSYQALESVWVTRWVSHEHDSDFRPWFECLATHPPKQLRAVEVGTYSGRYDKLGPVAPMVGANPSLRSLFLTGVMDSVAPFGNESLESFQVQTGKWSATPMKRFIDWTKFDHLHSFIATGEVCDARGLTRLWKLPALQTLELSLFELHPEFFALSQDTRIREADLGNCRWPIEPNAEKAIIEAVVSAAPYLQQVSLILPVDAQDAAERFEAAGLSCEYGSY